MASEDRNNLAWWWPKLHAAGLPTPHTAILETELPLLAMLDGPGGALDGAAYSDFLVQLLATADKVRYLHDPFFLRTGHTSGKHEWRDTCYVQDSHSLGDHVYHLVEYSAMADLVGLPVQTWVCRALLPTRPVYTLPRFGGMPLVREFRYFVRRASYEDKSQPYIEHVQPYWPPGAVAQGLGVPATAPAEWQAQLREISVLPMHLHKCLTQLARSACNAVGGGYWSIDFLQCARGEWWLTDMALGERSYRYEPEGWKVGG